MRLWAAYVPAVGGEVAGVVEGEGAVPTAGPGGRLCGVRGVVAPWGLRRGCVDGRRSEGRERGLRMRHGFLILASRGGAM